MNKFQNHEQALGRAIVVFPIILTEKVLRFTRHPAGEYDVNLLVHSGSTELTRPSRFALRAADNPHQLAAVPRASASYSSSRPMFDSAETRQGQRAIRMPPHAS